MFRALILVILVSGSCALTTAQDSQAERLVREGVEFTSAGQFAQAIRAFEEAIKLEPDSGAAYAALGRAYFKMREWRRAAAYLRRAAALNALQKQAENSAQVIEVAVVEPVRPTAQPAPTPHAVMSAASFYAQKIPAPATTAIQFSSTLALELTAPDVTQEPAGTNVSMDVSPPVTGESGPVSPIPLNVPSEDVSLTKVYRVGPGDVLDIRINEAQPQQSTLFTVTPAGLLEHPLLAEPLSVAALTTEEIQTKIQDDLKARALIENPAVSVGVRDYTSHAILVSGLVKDSGTKFLRREAIPLYVVVADAQPLPEAAKVTVVRNERNQVFEIELTNVAHMNMLVRTGDVINLHPNETQFVYVGGEVKAPGEKIFRRGLTLMQAILSAGGVTSKSKVAEVGRDDGRGFLVKTSFTLKDIQTGKVMDPQIKAGDRIMILR